MVPDQKGQQPVHAARGRRDRGRQAGIGGVGELVEVVAEPLEFGEHGRIERVAAAADHHHAALAHELLGEARQGQAVRRRLELEALMGRLGDADGDEMAAHGLLMGTTSRHLSSSTDLKPAGP